MKNNEHCISWQLTRINRYTFRGRSGYILWMNGLVYAIFTLRSIRTHLFRSGANRICVVLRQEVCVFDSCTSLLNWFVPHRADTTFEWICPTFSKDTTFEWILPTFSTDTTFELIRPTYSLLYWFATHIQRTPLLNVWSSTVNTLWVLRALHGRLDSGHKYIICHCYN